MNLFEKLIYLADKIEPDRRMQGVKRLRWWAFRDIHRAMWLSSELTIEWLIKRRMFIHPHTVALWNSMQTLAGKTRAYR